MKSAIALLAAFAALASASARAEMFDINLGENSVRLALAGPLSHIVSDLRGQYDTGVVIRPKTEDDLLQVHVGALVTGDAGARGVDLAAGLGVRGVYIGRDDDSGGAVALGGQLEARLPSFNRVGLTGYGYYAPSATSFGQVDEYIEYGAAVDYQVVRDAAVYVGYRNINYDIGDLQGITADSGFRAGLRLSF
jgi:hypothetical protein